MPRIGLGWKEFGTTRPTKFPGAPCDLRVVMEEEFLVGVLRGLEMDRSHHAQAGLKDVPPPPCRGSHCLCGLEVIRKVARSALSSRRAAHSSESS
jgi:hypothetical protein